MQCFLVNQVNIWHHAIFRTFLFYKIILPVVSLKFKFNWEFFVVVVSLFAKSGGATLGVREGRSGLRTEI